LGQVLAAVVVQIGTHRLVVVQMSLLVVSVARWRRELGKLLGHDLRRHVKRAAVAVLLIAASKAAVQIVMMWAL
jgi:hypothetical protein